MEDQFSARGGGVDSLGEGTKPDCALLEGAISGRALYDGRLDAKKALAVLNGSGK